MSESKGTRKFKGARMKVLPLKPICKRCPWEIWCKYLNFRTKTAEGKIEKVCPVWWMVIGRLREKGILRDRPLVPPSVPVSSEEARVIMEAARRKRRQKLGMAA